MAHARVAPAAALLLLAALCAAAAAPAAAAGGLLLARPERDCVSPAVRKVNEFGFYPEAFRSTIAERPAPAPGAVVSARGARRRRRRARAFRAAARAFRKRGAISCRFFLAPTLQHSSSEASPILPPTPFPTVSKKGHRRRRL